MTDLLFNRKIAVEFIDRDNPADVVTVEDPELPDKEPLKISFQVEKSGGAISGGHRAYIELHNLADATSARINFRKRILGIDVPATVKDKTILFKFGRKVNLYAGYDGRVKRIFSGVVISAITSREGTVKITRIESRNAFYELMQLPIKYTAVKNSLKSNAVLEILKQIDATLQAKEKTTLQTRLAGRVFKDTVKYEGTAYNVINRINKGLTGVISIQFDDIGTSFNPLGVANDTPLKIYDAALGQILGTPEPEETGVSFNTQLDPDLKISDPVGVISDTIRAFFRSNFVVSRVTHVGSNRASEPFESRVAAVFDRTNQYNQQQLAG